MSTLLIGLSIGMLLFILAAGLTLIFGMMGIINFAHGALYMLGAYVAYQVVRSGGSFWLALLVSPLVLAVVGALMERLTLRPLYDRAHEFQLLATFGAILVLEEAVRVLWGLDFKRMVAPAGLDGAVTLFGSQVSLYRLFVIGFGLAVSLALFLVLERSPLGTAVRACQANGGMAACVGIDVGRVRTAVFAIGAALAGVGGTIAGPLLPIQLQMGFTIIIDCFVVVIIGGLGNIRGAVLGALLVGMTRAYGQAYAPDWIDVATYTLLIATLLLRPQGLFNQRERLA